MDRQILSEDNASFAYKGKAVDIKHVGRELGVRYVLEGTLQALKTHRREVVVQAGLLEFVPRGRDLLALDVGAGSGRDAAWLASLGYEVVAAEPAAGMRREASKRRLRLRQDQQVPEWAGLRSIG